ncbi:MAG: hypothetical protein J6C86_08395 [Bacteroidaceae bacterium]|nr:hypothetical protein [Bacteroidaceae bacterium]
MKPGNGDAYGYVISIPSLGLSIIDKPFEVYIYIRCEVSLLVSTDG